jgi:CRISPR system Cascade subunit CasB
MTVTEPSPEQSADLVWTPQAGRGETQDDLLVRHVRTKVHSLQSAYLADSSTAAASLAKLRRAVNVSPGSDPSIWFETLDAMPERLIGRGDAATTYETAIHATLTLHAVHQQSQRVRMHQLDYGLGRSVRLLAKRGTGEPAKNDNPVLRRFHALGTASSLPETTHHLRGLVTQLRSEAIPLDYGLLARDLRRLQDPYTASSVRLQWGRDYHRVRTEPAEPAEAAGAGTDIPTDIEPETGASR